MDNFEEKFLEQLAKARARLEGKEAYDDELIKNEFIPDAEPVKKDASEKKAEKPKAEQPQKPVKTAPEKEEKTASKPVVEKKAVEQQPVVKKEKTKPAAKASKTIKTDKKALICGCAVVAISFALSCLRIFINNDSEAWQTFMAYMPFIGIVLGSVSVIWGALLIKNNKKGAAAIILGMLAILIPIFFSSLGL